MRLSTEELRQPVSKDLPCGKDLEYDPVFQEMEISMLTIPEQQFGGTIIPGQGPDGKRVAKQVDNLNKRTRDLRVLTNGALADLSLKGLKAFSDSLESLNTCLEVFWDNIYPQLDADEDNDATARITCLQLLNDYNTVSFVLERAPLLKVRRLGTFSLHDIELAEGKRKPVGDEKVQDIGLIQGAFAKADAATLSTLSEGVWASIAQIKRTDEICRRLAMNTALYPDFDLIMKVLGEIRQVVKRYAPAAAVKWDRMAADQGMAEAQCNLGVSYAQGQGVPQDHAEAVKWYRMAADQGMAEAQSNLGEMYAGGKGVPQDHAEAYVWSSLAALNGSYDNLVHFRDNRDLAASKLAPEALSTAQKRVANLFDEINKRKAELE